MSEEALQQQKIDHLNKYIQDYYRAHKKASDCELCKKTFSNINALRRHQAKSLKRKLLQATDTIEKFKENGSGKALTSSGRGTQSSTIPYL